MYTKCLHCNCQLKNSVYNIYNMRLVITIERLPWRHPSTILSSMRNWSTRYRSNGSATI